MNIKKKPLIIAVTALFSLAIPACGYYYVGWLVALLFLIGYLFGFFSWLLVPVKVPFRSIKYPYWLTLFIFLCLHKVEEKKANFFEVLGDKITGVPVPQVTPFLVISLLILPIGAWLLIPYLVRRHYDLGYYLAWTFFASMGVIEPAHFVFPILTNEPYDYFPGMITALPLAAAGWWGMYKLLKTQKI